MSTPPTKYATAVPIAIPTTCKSHENGFANSEVPMCTSAPLKLHEKSTFTILTMIATIAGLSVSPLPCNAIAPVVIILHAGIPSASTWMYCTKYIFALTDSLQRSPSGAAKNQSATPTTHPQTNASTNDCPKTLCPSATSPPPIALAIRACAPIPTPETAIAINQPI